MEEKSPVFELFKDCYRDPSWEHSEEVTALLTLAATLHSVGDNIVQALAVAQTLKEDGKTS